MIDPLVIPIVAIVGLFVTTSIIAIAHYVYLIARLRDENALKQEMLLRGYSADEIAKVIGCGRGLKAVDGSDPGAKADPGVVRSFRDRKYA
jgi:hypothetical protein